MRNMNIFITCQIFVEMNEQTFVIFFGNPESSREEMREICSQKPLKSFPLDKSWWVTRIEIRVLKGLRGFVVCLHVKDRFLVKCVTFVHFCVQECNFCF